MTHNINKIRITATIMMIMLITAMLMMPGLGDTIIGQSLTVSDMISQDYLDEYARAFSTHLPVMVIQTDEYLMKMDYEGSKDAPPRAAIWFFDNGGENRLTDTPAQVYSYATAAYRGNSSYRAPKKPFTLVFYDNNYLDMLEPSFFGLAPANEWILRSPYFDKSLIRDWFSYELAATVLDAQPRGAPVQLFMQDGESSMLDYYGVYFLCQSIPAMAQTELNLGQFRLSDSDEADFSGGGYIVQLDRDSPYYRAIRFPGELENYRIMYPQPRNITSAQERYIANEIVFYHNFLNRKGEYIDLDDNEWDFWKYIDVQSFIDCMLLNEILKITDFGQFSTYMYRPAGGKLSLGPIWDCDLSMGIKWEQAQQHDYFYEDNFFSFSLLFGDEDFTAQFINSWQDYRSSIWTNEEIMRMFDNMVRYLTPAAQQNAKRWPELYDGESFVWPNYEPYVTSWEEEIENTRIWLERRLAWLDEYIPMLIYEGPNEINEALREQP